MGLINSVGDKLGGLFGLDGGQGDYYRPQQSQSLAHLQGLDAAYNSGKIEDAGKALQNGTSLQQVLSQLSPEEKTAFATSPIYASMVGSSQVQSDPLLSGMFGAGGQQDQAQAEATQLANSGYTLKPEDYDAMGQASNSIARQFGTQEQGLSQALAARGLSSTANGVNASQFSGLYGNKNEQLGQMQQQIAQNRMNTNMQRLQQTRQYVAQLGTEAQQAENAKVGANFQGLGAIQGVAGQLGGAEQHQEALNQQSFASQQANKQLTLGNALQSGVYSDVSGGGVNAFSKILGGSGGAQQSPTGGTKTDNTGTAGSAGVAGENEYSGYQNASNTTSTGSSQGGGGSKAGMAMSMFA